jgi:predicted CoA-binding protein
MFLGGSLSQREIKEILQKYKTIAIVGLSSDANKPSYKVAAYMKQHGYKIIPINPTVTEVLGEKSYPSLLSLPEELQKTVEVVDIFRKPIDVLPVVEEAVELRRRHGKPLVVWMQLGIINLKAQKVAQKAHLTVIMDHCLKIEHEKMV